MATTTSLATNRVFAPSVMLSFASLVLTTSLCFIHMGMLHEQWLVEQQSYIQQVKMVQPLQPHLAVVESTMHRPMPIPTGDVPAVDMPPSIPVATMAAAMEANRGRLFNNLFAIAKRIITGDVEAGPEKRTQVEAGLHALAARVAAPPPLQYANPPPRAKRSTRAKPFPYAKRRRKVLKFAKVRVLSSFCAS